MSGVSECHNSSGPLDIFWGVCGGGRRLGHQRMHYPGPVPRRCLLWHGEAGWCKCKKIGFIFPSLRLNVAYN